MLNHLHEAHSRARTRIIMLLVWVSVFIVYQTTFISTPRLFVYPETGWFFAAIDIPEHVLALRGSPNETDMRKHLLYAPLGRLLYRVANRLRLLRGAPYDTGALLFPQALYGATSALIAYLLFLRLINRWRPAAIAACCYAFTYFMWLMSSVPESYALTTLTVNLFLLFILREKTARWLIWYPTTIGLVTLCSLCDLRFISLMVIPLYLAGRAPGLKPAQRIGLMCAIVVGACCLIGAAYALYHHATGREAFGIEAMWNWLLIYRQKGTAGHRLLDFRSSARWLRAIFIDSISPFYGNIFNHSPGAIQKIHASLAYCFWILVVTLVLAALRSIRMSVLTSRGLRALLCWLVAHFVQLQMVSAGMGAPHAVPLVLPLMLLIVPGVIRAWEPRRFGTKIMAVAAAAMLANNLMLMNEARLAWQRPAVVQSPADRLYLLPGEIERMQLLEQKMLRLCPASERDRMKELLAQTDRDFSEKERREMTELTRRRIDRLTPRESAQFLDIMHRYHEAIKLDREGG
jgi:hypothetical protein